LAGLTIGDELADDLELCQRQNINARFEARLPDHPVEVGGLILGIVEAVCACNPKRCADDKRGECRLGIDRRQPQRSQQQHRLFITPASKD
jgi:hypothetical protein